MNWRKIDSWLTRVTHASQVGLFVLAFIGYFFTVIPLYEKALLDEAIAEKELRLRELDRQSKDTYKIVRQLIVREYLYLAGPECSGLMDNSATISMVTGRSWSSENFEDLVIERSIAQCLQKHLLQASSLRQLVPQDKAKFEGRVLAIGRRLDLRRVELLNEFESAVPGRRFEVASDFGNLIRSELVKLTRLEWWEENQGNGETATTVGQPESTEAN